MLYSRPFGCGKLFRSVKEGSNQSPGRRETGNGPGSGGPRQRARRSGASFPYNFPGVQFPRIEADKRVTFRFVAPDAKKVQVSHRQTLPFDMVKGADGAWTYTSAPQGPGYHNYWMLVDGATCWTRARKRSSATAICATALRSPSRAWIVMT